MFCLPLAKLQVHMLLLVGNCIIMIVSFVAMTFRLNTTFVYLSQSLSSLFFVVYYCTISSVARRLNLSLGLWELMLTLSLRAKFLLLLDVWFLLLILDNFWCTCSVIWKDVDVRTRSQKMLDIALDNERRRKQQLALAATAEWVNDQQDRVSGFR